MGTFVMPAVMQDNELNTLITKVCTNARDGQGELQKAIVQAVLSLKANGNSNPLSRILNELPNSSRVRVIMQYVKAFAPVKFKQAEDVHGNKLTQQDGRERIVTKLIKKSVESDWKLEAMLATTYYDWSRPKTDKEIEYSIGDTLKRFIKKLDKALAAGGEPTHLDHLRIERNLAVQAATACGVAL